jgi:GAF domain-containing protein
MAAMAKVRVGTKRRTLAELEAELEKRTAERDEALAHEAAVAELLSVINFSPGDLTPVFDAILEKAMRLCGVEYGDLELYDGANFRAVATYGLSDAFAEQVRRGYLGADNPATRPLIAGERLSHIADLSTVDFSKVFKADPAADEAHQTLLCVPLRRDGRLLGMIASARKEVRPFSDKEIALLENFAAQALIAMENARLITETQEALDQQTAAAEVLGVINAHPGDLALVFDAMPERATRLCEAHTGHLFRFENNAFWRLASHGVPEDFDNMFPPGTPIPLLPHSSPPTRMVETRSVVHVPDSKEDESYRLGSPDMLAAVEAGILTVLFVPLLKEGEVVGHFTMHRMEVKPFTDSLGTHLHSSQCAHRPQLDAAPSESKARQTLNSARSQFAVSVGLVDCAEFDRHVSLGRNSWVAGGIRAYRACPTRGFLRTMGSRPGSKQPVVRSFPRRRELRRSRAARRP